MREASAIAPTKLMCIVGPMVNVCFQLFKKKFYSRNFQS